MRGRTLARFRLGRGRVFLAYVVVYCAGRVWIEALRIDPAEQVLGLRLNIWTCLVVGLAALVAFVVSARRHPGVEESVLVPGRAPADDDAAAAGGTAGEGGGASAQAPSEESGERDAASRDVR